jgi:hypothetical protein
MSATAPRTSVTTCIFNCAQEFEYDKALVLQMRGYQWNLAEHCCQTLCYMLSHEASQTLVIALVVSTTAGYEMILTG